MLRIFSVEYSQNKILRVFPSDFLRKKLLRVFQKIRDDFWVPGVRLRFMTLNQQNRQQISTE